MRGNRAWLCSGSLLPFAVGFCIGIAEILYTFHFRVPTGNCVQESQRLEQIQYKYHKISERNALLDGVDNRQVLLKKSVKRIPKGENVRILCWVMTQEHNLRNKTQMIKDTWGKRCDITLYFTSKTDETFPTIGLDVPDGRRHLFVKTSEAFKYIYKHHLDDADWFLKADDDTYVIVENLRQFLQDKNTSSPVYYGQVFYRYVSYGYNSGGAGYVLGREALARFVENGSRHINCRVKKGSEDLAMGRCLNKLGVSVGLTKDSLGNEKFNWNNGFHPIIGHIPEWIKRYVRSNTVCLAENIG